MTENTAAKRPKKIMFLMPKDTPKIVFFSQKSGYLWRYLCDWYLCKRLRLGSCHLVVMLNKNINTSPLTIHLTYLLV